MFQGVAFASEGRPFEESYMAERATGVCWPELGTWGIRSFVCEVRNIVLDGVCADVADAAVPGFRGESGAKWEMSDMT